MEKTKVNLVGAMMYLQDNGVKEIVINYSGGGDSGYLEDSFNNGDSVPAVVSDFCYNMLENRFGGWEINEGSQGRITFDFVSDNYSVYHEWNTEREQVAHEETITL